MYVPRDRFSVSRYHHIWLIEHIEHDKIEITKRMPEDGLRLQGALLGRLHALRDARGPPGGGFHVSIYSFVSGVFA